ncbi:hypothetical protein [Dysgonomonas macrotermitis]|uniref:Uncharacterized protein n=1 Tax=Dysgonomonas macrotermitis TaxID=1346286 RepID=A0A1M5G8M1_9BACT|nr:hypothetical protein [Dysgonomonas macrotermitis]SHG00034.1 hypothetical protein SAMN05444362_11392 [Dysgonomonas macrotermitis]
MKPKFYALFRFEMLIIILIFIAFSLYWIQWGKLLNVSGWNLPDLYRKSTNISNTILFFSKKDSPHLAKFIYIVPVLAFISGLFLYNRKKRTANIFLMITCFFGILVSLYMYYYFLSSKMFKLSNAGTGVHLLLVTSVTGILYTIMYSCKSRKTETPTLTGDKQTF